MELTGKIIFVLPAKSGVSASTGNPWMIQSYVIEVPGQYPKKCVFDIFGEDRIKQFNIQSGEDVTIQFDIDAREYHGRWFNSVKAYNVIRGAIQQPAQAAQQQAVAQPPLFPDAQPAPAASEGNADDLPF
jgi:hypothetical protein